MMTLVALFAIKLPKHTPYVGGIAVLALGEYDKSQEPQVDYNTKRVMTIYKDGRWYALVGIPLSEKSKDIKVKVSYKDGSNITKSIKLVDKEYKKQYITLKTNKHVYLSKEDLARHKKEKKQSREVLDSYKNQNLSDLTMLLPVKSKLKGDFGKRRYFNNQPRKPHSGIDLSAPTGTPILAPLDGKVMIAKEFFFSGNVVYIDHGRGLVSMYAHLSKFDVKVGDIVKKGQIIGKVGATGRVTGPHLHFGVALNGNMINPELLF
jgi:murein DD-endopeptidase MepM/ murein hydrolase activator NlpD